MLHPPSKYNNYLSNFLAIRNAATGASSMPPSSSTPPPPSLPPQPQPLPPKSNAECDATHLDAISGSAGAKSFTIAAILGLKKKGAAAAAVAAMELPHKPNDLTVMNLSMHNSGLQMNQAAHNLLQQTQNLSQHPLKTAFSAYETSTDTRLLTNRLQLGFGQHLSAVPHHPAQHLAHFHGGTNAGNSNHNHNHNNNNNSNSNNNNNVYTANSNAASALQSLQQQFHQKSSAFHATNKEQKHKNDHVSKSKSSLKSKRVRTIFTPEQLERLEAEFERQQYMVGPERLYLAHTLQLTEAQVKVWFQNRRIKWRKHHLELTQQRLAIIRQHQLPVTTAQPANGHQDSPPRDGSNGAAMGKSTTSDSIASVAGAPNTLESELSVCTDSMDSNSLHDVEDL